MHKLAVHKIPSIESKSMIQLEHHSPVRRGIVSTAHPSAEDQVIFFDVIQKEVGVLDKAREQTLKTFTVDCHQDPLTPGPIAVDAHGRNALVLSRASRFGDNKLLRINLETGEQTTVHEYAGPGWLMGQFLDDNILVFEQRLGDEPSFFVRRNDKIIWNCAGTQPMVLPQIWDNEFAIMLACTKPNPLTGTGPIQLCALEILSGTLFALTSIEGHRLSLRKNVIRVEQRNQNAHDFALTFKTS